MQFGIGPTNIYFAIFITEIEKFEEILWVGYDKPSEN